MIICACVARFFRSFFVMGRRMSSKQDSSIAGYAIPILFLSTCWHTKSVLRICASTRESMSFGRRTANPVVQIAPSCSSVTRATVLLSGLTVENRISPVRTIFLALLGASEHFNRLPVALQVSVLTSDISIYKKVPSPHLLGSLRSAESSDTSERNTWELERLTMISSISGGKVAW